MSMLSQKAGLVKNTLAVNPEKFNQEFPAPPKMDRDQI